jgi:hypothetical protein
LIAFDTNILVYARREETPFYRKAYKLIKELASGENTWALPWTCVYEFLRIVMHPCIFDPPTPLKDVIEDLESLLQFPSLLAFPYSLMNQITRNTPLTVFIEHGCNGFNSRLLVFKLCIVHDHHVLPIRNTWQTLRVHF